MKEMLLNNKENLPRKKLGYWAPLEGIEDPKVLLNYAKIADKIKFDSLAASSHFHPWRHSNTYATHVIPWLSAALEGTSNIEVGTGVICPTFRFHPGELAQIFASIDHMYPRRIFLGVGTGELLNEVPLGYEWPPYSERRERLIEAIKIIRMLWNEDFVSYEGKYYNLKDANLYTKPKTKIPIHIAAEAPKSAEMAGRFGDGLFTPLSSRKKLKEVVLPSFEQGAKKEGKNPEALEKVVEARISYDADPERALDSCRHWAVTTLLDHIEKTHDPREFEKFEEEVTDEMLKKAFKIVTEPEGIINYLEEFLDLGFTKIFLHSSSPNELKFLDLVKKDILPYFKGLQKR